MFASDSETAFGQQSLVVHEYTRHIFGARDSPTCANFALQKIASDNQAEYPEAVSTVVKKLLRFFCFCIFLF